MTGRPYRRVGQRVVAVHRLVAIAVWGAAAVRGRHVVHRDGDRAHNAAANPALVGLPRAAEQYRSLTGSGGPHQGSGWQAAGPRAARSTSRRPRRATAASWRRARNRRPAHFSPLLSEGRVTSASEARPAQRLAPRAAVSPIA